MIASRSTNQARSAAATGATACMKKTLATGAWLSATMNEPEATAMQTATARPAPPIDRNASSGLPRLETATYAASARQAKTARPATWVVVSTESSRCSTPAVDQARAADATSSCPRRRLPCSPVGGALIASVNQQGAAQRSTNGGVSIRRTQRVSLRLPSSAVTVLFAADADAASDLALDYGVVHGDRTQVGNVVLAWEGVPDPGDALSVEECIT